MTLGLIGQDLDFLVLSNPTIEDKQVPGLYHQRFVFSSQALDFLLETHSFDCQTYSCLWSGWYFLRKITGQFASMMLF